MSQPCIILITADTLGRNMVSAYGARGGVHTPHIDRLATEGLLFEQAYCASPVCTPARSAWYSGQHACRNGAWTNNVSMRRGGPLLAERFTVASYRCVHLGRWHLDGGYNGTAKPDGGFAEPWYDLSSFLERAHPKSPPVFEYRPLRPVPPA